MTNIIPISSAGKPRRSPRQRKALEPSRLIPVEIRAKLGSVYPDNDAYIMTPVGKCLEPEICDGDEIFVSPAMPIECGEFAVLYFKNPAITPLIKRVFMKPMPGWETLHPDSEVVPLIIVEQLNPPSRYAFPVNMLAAVHRVAMTWKPGAYSIAVVTQGDAE